MAFVPADTPGSLASLDEEDREEVRLLFPAGAGAARPSLGEIGRDGVPTIVPLERGEAPAHNSSMS